MSTGHFRHFIAHYLAPHPNRAVKELYLSRVILDFAVAMVMVFEPIYLYRQGFSIVAILGFYAALYTLYFFLLPLGGRIGRAKGFEHAMLYSSPFLILYYLSFFAIAWDWHFIFLALVTLAIQKVLYWPSYHSDFAAWSQTQEEGREISNMTALYSFSAALGPVIGGLTIALGGFPALFILTSVLIVASNIPLLTTPEPLAAKDFPYWPAIKRVFERARRRQTVAFAGFGEEIVSLIIWPIFIALKVPDLLSLGTIISLAMIAMVLVTLYVGGLIDDGAGLPVLKNGAVFTAGSWIIRPLVAGGLGVFLFDSFYRVSKNMVQVPLTAMAYDNAKRESGTGFIVFFQMALALGKVIAALLAMLIFFLFPNGWWMVFLMAGAFTVLYSLLREKVAA